MRSIVRVGLFLFATAAMSELTLAGPEIERFSQNSDVQAASPAEIPPVKSDLSDLNQLLATPQFADPTTGALDPDLSRGEHPMIPLPPSIWAGMAMLLGVAVYSIRQQRTTRVNA